MLLLAAPAALPLDATVTSDGDPGLDTAQRWLVIEESTIEKWWGSNELVRITTSSSVLGSSFDILYAARVRRRWRRATAADGTRVVEGLEIVNTYRVLDGLAGVEFPTSTTKSTLRLTRPR